MGMCEGCEEDGEEGCFKIVGYRRVCTITRAKLEEALMWSEKKCDKCEIDYDCPKNGRAECVNIAINILKEVLE